MSSFGSFHLGPIVFRGRPTRGASTSGAYRFKHVDLGDGRHRIYIKSRDGRRVIRTTMSHQEWMSFIGGTDKTNKSR